MGSYDGKAGRAAQRVRPGRERRKPWLLRCCGGMMPHTSGRPMQPVILAAVFPALLGMAIAQSPLHFDVSGGSMPGLLTMDLYPGTAPFQRSEEHTSELQSRGLIS